MCGITGVFSFDRTQEIDNNVIRNMTNSISHRGPDGEGIFTNKNVGLGHRRLSIIDLTTGDQPMFSHNKDIAIVFNGEIYNYVEIKEELIKSGYSFTTTSDTEVIIYAYKKWGKKCLEKFNGMWAFALWDTINEELFISRDRLGEKPLYYALYKHFFIFGSELKSLFSFGVPKEINSELYELYLSLSYIPTPFTFYKNCCELEPGSYISVSTGGHKINKYWDIPQPDESTFFKDEKLVFDKFSEMLLDSVKIRMRSDVPFGAFLSGGLDSSSIVSLMSKISESPVQTFTIGAEEKSYDESGLARVVSERYGTNHHQLIPQPENVEYFLDKIVYHYDQPFGKPSAIPTGIISKCAQQHVKMVLTGDGGDEALSGYPTNFVERYSNYPGFVNFMILNFFTPLLSLLSVPLKSTMRYSMNRFKRIAYTSALPFEHRLQYKISYGEPLLTKKLLAGLKGIMTIEEFIKEVFNKCTFTDSFYKRMYYDLKILLPSEMLTKVDRMSMAYSLETRVPFLDHRLVEFLCVVDKRIKIEFIRTKSILRNTIGKNLPGIILRKPKKGFTIPLREWFRDGKLDSYLNYIQHNDIGLNSKEIKRIISIQKSGKGDYSRLLWALIVLYKCINA